MVHMVEVMVLKMVDTVVVIWVTMLVPEVIVLVTGHVVTVERRLIINH